jgi:hypothetical protein
MSDTTTPRITEKRYLTIPPTALTANSTTSGLITIANTYGFKVGQTVLFKGIASKLVKIKKIISETQLIVIAAAESVTTKNKLDMSAYVIGDTVELQEVKRPVIDILEIQRQTYEEEPTVATRQHQVDWLGRSYDVGNPLPIQLPANGQAVNPLAKFIERVLTNTTTETYSYYESSAKVTLYNTITVIYVSKKLKTIVSAEWS